jgi:hypothetical protein
MMTKIILKWASFFVLLALFSASVSAFGIVMPYWGERPLVLHPGESKDVVAKLQNIGDEDVTVEVKLTKGSEMASIVDQSNIYTVPKGSVDTAINLRVYVPSDAPVGSSYEISLSIKDVGAKGSGMVQLTTAIDKAFPVIVEAVAPELPVEEQKPEESGSLIWPIVLILVIVVVILVLFYSKAKKAGIAKRSKGR